MICGYVSCAVAVQAADLFPQTTDQWPVVTLSDIDSIVRALTLVPEELERRIAAPMVHIERSRAKYVAAHEGVFGGQRERQQYMTAWVANYEISDFLRLHRDPRLLFFRKAEYSALGKATHEEKRRLEEERRFEHDFFFMDRSHPPSLLSREEYREVQTTSFDGRSIFVIDLNGHFAVAKPVLLMSAGESVATRRS